MSYPNYAWKLTLVEKNLLSQRLVLTADSTEGALQRSPWQLVVASSGGLESLNTKKGAHKVSQSAGDI